MSKLRPMVLTTCGVLVLTAVWLVSAAPVWAQPPTQAGAASKSYVLPYLMVVLVVALGLLIVLRPSGRSSDVRTKSED